MKRVLLWCVVMLAAPAALAWTGIDVTLPDFVEDFPDPNGFAHYSTAVVPAGSIIYGIALEMDYDTGTSMQFPAYFLGVRVIPPTTSDVFDWYGSNWLRQANDATTTCIENYGGLNAAFHFQQDWHYWNHAWLAGTPSGGTWEFAWRMGSGGGIFAGTLMCSNIHIKLITEPPIAHMEDARIYEGFAESGQLYFDELIGNGRWLAARRGPEYIVDQPFDGSKHWRMWSGSDNIWKIVHAGGTVTINYTKPAGAAGEAMRFTLWNSPTPVTGGSEGWYMSDNCVASNHTTGTVPWSGTLDPGMYYLNLDAMNMAGRGVYTFTINYTMPAVADLNCDGAVNFFDIDPFVDALLGTPPTYPEYYALYPNCWHMLADCDDSGAVNFFDIDPFVDILLGG